MSRTRIYLRERLTEGATLDLPAQALAHLRARRVKPGETITLFDGGGHIAEARLTALERRQGRVSLLAVREESRESPLRVVLLQGMAKGDRMDTVVQKTTELGVDRIIPVITDHAVVQLDARRAERRRQHWQHVAIAACEQCGRNRVPQVAAPVNLDAALDEVTDFSGLLLEPAAEHTSATLPPPAVGFALLIGPEGGLSRAEHERAAQHGFLGLSLGPRILRTETAALTAVAALQLRLGDLG